MGCLSSTPVPNSTDPLVKPVKDKLHAGFAADKLANGVSSNTKNALAFLLSFGGWASLVASLKAGSKTEEAIGDEIVEYGRFLVLKVTAGDASGTSLVPSNAVFATWRTHAALGAEYSSFCSALAKAAGSAEPGSTGYAVGAQDAAEKGDAYTRTLTAYNQVFKAKYAASQWPATGTPVQMPGGAIATENPVVSVPPPVTGPTTKIFVKTLSGATMQFVVPLDSDVAGLKRLIQEKEDIPLDSVRLIFAGRQLDDSSTIRACNIAEESTIHLVNRKKPAAASS